MKIIRIGSKKIGDGCPTFVVAEMAWSHDGSLEKAKAIVQAASDAGADAINLHITSLPDYMVPHYGSGKGRISQDKGEESIYEYLARINLSASDWDAIIRYARRLGLMVSTMCNDMVSLNLVAGLEPDIYMIHSSCLSDQEFVRSVAEQHRPVFISTGGSTLGEIEQAIMTIREARNDEIVLLYGFQNYPTKLKDVHLLYMRSLKQLFDLSIGYSDHTDGNSPLALIAPLMAVALGANVLEKHLTHNRSMKGEDWESALNPDEFKTFVQYLREIEKMFGSPGLRPFSPSELHYREVVKKRAVARVAIHKGEKLSKDKVVFKRSDEGVYPEELKHLLGRPVSRNLQANDGITWEVVI